MGGNNELDGVKAHLTALSTSLPELIERLRPHVGQAGMPDAEKERQRLLGFAAYLDHYGRADSRVVGPLDLAEVVQEAAALTRGEVEQKARLSLKLHPVPFVKANPRQLGQVLISLLINASQAIPAGAPERHQVGIEVDTNDVGWARIAIADTGSGIAADVLPRIFDALYSTKRGAGMGIGLAVTKEIVEALGGTIAVESTLGVGTMFIVELPPAP